MGIELGVGYLSIVPETSKIAPGIAKALDGAEKGAAQQGKSLGHTLAHGLGKSLKLGAVSAGVAAGGLLGTAMVKGMGRLNAIEGARAKMGTLIEDAKDVDGAMQNALNSVTGTAFGLGEAAATAASMVASGIKPGERLEGVLKTVADTAAIAGSSMADMGLIFGSVAARGKLQGDDMMQLLSRGIPVLQLLSKELGVTSAEVSEMVSKGKIDFATFERAMAQGMGGGAEAMGKTFQGSLANMQAALGRFGAVLLGPVHTNGPRVFTALTGTIDVATEAVRPLVEMFANALQPHVESFANFLITRFNPALKDLSEQFAQWLPGAMKTVGQVLQDLGVTMQDTWDKFRSDPNVQASWAALSDAFKATWEHLKDLGPQFQNIASTAGQAIAAVQVETWKILGQALETAAPLIRDIVQFLADHPGIVTAFFTAWAGSKAVQQATSPLQGVASAVSKVATAFAVAGLAKELGTIAEATKTTNPVMSSFARMGSRVATAMNPMGTAARLVMKPMSGMLRLFAGAIPKLLGFIGPWAPIIGVVAAAGGALYLFFTKTETGRELWDKFTGALSDGWEFIKGLFASGLEKLQGFWNDLKGAWDEIVSLFTLTSEDGETPFLTKLLGADVANIISDFLHFTGKVTAAFGEIFDAFRGKDSGSGALSMLLGDGMADTVMSVVETLRSVFGGLKDLATGMWGIISTGINGVVGLLGGAFSVAWEGAKVVVSNVIDGVMMAWNNTMDVVTTVWEQVKSTLTTGWEIIKTVVFTAWEVALDVVATAISVFSGLLKGDWAAVGEALTKGWQSIKSRVFDAFEKVLGLLAQWWQDSWDRIKGLIGRMGARLKIWFNGLKQDIFGKFADALRGLADKWQEMKDAVMNKVGELAASLAGWVRDFKTNFKQAVADALMVLVGKFGDLKTQGVQKVNALGDFLKDFPNKVKGWFSNAGSWLVQAGKDMIQGLWNGIKNMWNNVQGWAADRLKLSIGGKVHGGVGMATGGLAAYAAGGRHGGYRLPTEGPGTEVEDGFLAFSQKGLPIARLDAGEWVINQRSSRRYHRELQQINNGTFPKLPGYASGGVIGSITSLVKEHFPMMTITSTQRSTNDYHGAGLAVDFSNGGDAGTPEMKKAARFFADNYGSELLELIHSPFGDNIKNGKSVGDGFGFYGSATMAQHRNHVHVAAKNPLGAPSKKPGESLEISVVAGGDSADGSAQSSASSSSSSSSAGSVKVSWGSAQSLYDMIAKRVGVQDDPPEDRGDSVTPSSSSTLSGEKNDDGAAGSGWGHDFFVKEVARAAKSMGLPEAAAKIGIATTLVESGNPLKMYANKRVPESLEFRHDAIGSDYDSIGLFQQRQAGWGTVAQRMTPIESAKLFYNRLKQFDWQSMDPGAAAQKVQVSAFPGRYATQMSAAASMLTSAGVFDTGGVLPHLGAAFNLSGKPEIVINNDQLTALSRLANNVGSLVEEMRSNPGNAAQIETTVFSGNYRGTDYHKGSSLEEDDPLTDAALQVHQFLSNVGGDWVTNSEIVQDAELGLAQTRRQLAKETDTIAEQEKEVAELRAELAKLSGEESGLSTAATRRLEDAERALTRAREDAGKAKNASGQAAAARRIENAELKLQRAREDAAKDLDKSGAKNAKEQKKLLEKLAKAEDKLSVARQKSANASKRLEAAERTVLASRGQALSDISDLVGKSFASVAGGLSSMLSAMGELSATFDKAREAVIGLNREHVTAQLASARAARDERMAEGDVARARAQGALSIAKAEAAVGEARKKALDELHAKGSTSLVDLGAALDRFTLTGVFDIQDMAATMSQAIIDATVNTTQEVLEKNEEVTLARLTAADEVAAAEDKYAEMRWAALDATLKQAHVVDLLAIAQEKLNIQALNFYGMTSQQASRGASGWDGVKKFVGGFFKAAGSVAMGVMSGGAAIIPAALGVFSGVKDMVDGGTQIAAYKDDIKKSWDAADGWGKASLVGGALLQGAGSAASVAYGAHTGDWSGATQLQKAAHGLGESVTMAPFTYAKHANDRAESVEQEKTSAAKLDYEQRSAVMNAERARDQQERQERRDQYAFAKEIAQARIEIVKANTKEEAIAANELAKVAADRRDQMLEVSRQNRERLQGISDALRRDLVDTEQRSRGAAPNVHAVNIQVQGDAVGLDTLQQVMASVEKDINDVMTSNELLQLRVSQIENPPVAGAVYAGSHRY